MKIQNLATHNDANFDSSTRAKLTDAAQQFEGMLLQELLKPLRSKNDDGWNDGDEDSEDGSDTINSFGVEAVAKAISQNGGLGIARQVIQQVTAEHAKNHSALSGKEAHK